MKFRHWLSVQVRTKLAKVGCGGTRGSIAVVTMAGVGERVVATVPVDLSSQEASTGRSCSSEHPGRQFTNNHAGWAPSWIFRFQRAQLGPEHLNF